MERVVRELALREPMTVSPDMPYTELVHLFVAGQLDDVVVVNENESVVGTISPNDLLRATDQACDDEVDIGEPAKLEDRFAALKAKEIASPDVVWISLDMPVREVARRMRDDGLHRVLVGDDEGDLAGLLTAFDVLAQIDLPS